MGVALIEKFFQPWQLSPHGSTSPEIRSWRQARIRETAIDALFGLGLGVAGLPDFHRYFRLLLPMAASTIDFLSTKKNIRLICFVESETSLASSTCCTNEAVSVPGGVTGHGC